MVSNDFIFYLLSTARTSHGTNNLKMKVPNIFFDYGLISTFASNASLVARRLVNHRVFDYPQNQSKFAANYTYHVDTSRHFVYFEVNICARDPTPKVKFPDK